MERRRHPQSRWCNKSFHGLTSTNRDGDKNPPFPYHEPRKRRSNPGIPLANGLRTYCSLERRNPGQTVSTSGNIKYSARKHAAVVTTEEEWEELVQEEEKPYAILRKTTTASELAQKAMDKTKRTFEQMVPEEYRRHSRTFDEKESHRFPPERPWDHAIELLPDAPKSFDCKIYPMAKGEEDSLREFIKEQLEKGYIRPSKSPYASPFFFIKKKDGKLRPVQDYRRLNSFT